MARNIGNTSSVWRAIDWLRSMATYGRHTVELLKTSIFWVVSSAWVFFVLVLVAIPDLMMNSRRQSKTLAPDPRTRLLPIPIQYKGQIFAIMPDGSRVKVEPLAAVTHARAWNDVVFGGFVWHETKLPD